ncbi:YraN family protein [Thiohalobacter sp.]|uniref:YraN family protein n=1 Tax=Thiohalobacter sp. TaxID=2025948 RepID=UPI00260E2A34|nr:YraN family protein [Thiohalobacter sp.]
MERLALGHLKRQGLRLLARNYPCRGGELDLVMLDGDMLVFVEVRYRRHDGHGSGADSIDHRKRHRIIRCARHWLQANPQHRDRPARFDVVSLGSNRGTVSVDWIRQAFDCND